MSKIARLGLRLLLTFGALLLVGAAFAIPGAGSKAKSAPVTIKTGGPVEISKCSPCHTDLNDFNNPNLVNFNHPVHFKRGIKCPACHTSFAHQPGGTVKPTMDLCANCHTLDHGKQGRTASGECKLCHPPAFKLTPDDHDAADFKGDGHAAAGKTDLQKCLVCHKSEDCENCHKEIGLQPAAADTYRRFGLWPVPQEQGPEIIIGAEPVTMGTCNACHRDLQKWKNDKLINFNHPAHFKRQITCDKCHEKWPHSAGEIDKPKMDACVRCHRLNHNAQGRLVAAEKGAYPNDYCLTCHPRDMKLKPDWHTAEFAGGDHKVKAKADRGLCRGCHIQSFCDNCHQTEIPHAQDWRSEHGKVAAGEADKTDEISCFMCHLRESDKPAYKTAPSCAKCHKAVVYPHKKPWAPQHGKTARGEAKESCSTCHVKQAFCDKCHGKVKMPHIKNWLGEHRQFLRDNSVEVCEVCHERSQCEQCHTAHKLHNRHTNFDFRTEL